MIEQPARGRVALFTQSYTNHGGTMQPSEHRGAVFLWAVRRAGVLAVILLNGMCMFSQQLPNGTHAVPLDSAAKFINNFASSPAAGLMVIKGGAYNRGIVDTILSYPGCVGLRFYFAQKDDGEKTMVLVGVDSAGEDITKRAVGESIWPCPPFCPSNSELIKK
jgi:hypothetical protein